MVTKKRRRGQTPASAAVSSQVSSSADDLLLAAIERGGDLSTTGRFLVTFKEGAHDDGVKHLTKVGGLKMASARDFKDQATVFEEAGDADALVFPEIGVAVVSGEAAATRGLTAEAAIAEDSPVHSIDPEYFMFA